MTVIAGTSVEVGTTSVQVAPADPTRNKVWFGNDDPAIVVYLALGVPAVVGAGVRLSNGGDRWDTGYTGVINAIATASSADVTVAGT